MDKVSKDMKISMLYDFYKNTLTQKQQEAIELYHNQDLSLSEITEHTGITRQGVRDNIKRGEQAMLKLEEEIGFAAFYYSVSEGIVEIKDIITSLTKCNDKSIHSEEITNSMDKILNILTEMER